MAHPLINTVMTIPLVVFFVLMAVSTRRQMVEGKTMKNGFYLNIMRVYLALSAMLISNLSFSVRNVFFDGQPWQDELGLIKVFVTAVLIHALYRAQRGRDFRGIRGALLDMKYLPSAIFAAFRPGSYKK